jgi:hypothetical protein
VKIEVDRVAALVVPDTRVTRSHPTVSPPAGAGSRAKR